MALTAIHCSSRTQDTTDTLWGTCVRAPRVQPHAFLLAPGRARGNALGVALALHVEGLLDLLRLHVLDLERVVIRARQQELEGWHPPSGGARAGESPVCNVRCTQRAS